MARFYTPQEASQALADLLRELANKVERRRSDRGSFQCRKIQPEGSSHPTYRVSVEVDFDYEPDFSTDLEIDD